ncbi:hypothetical protein Tco_1535541, partial [Tanacetum coccineum]
MGEDAFKQGRINAIDADEEITLVSVQNVNEEMFDVNVLDGEEVFVAEQEVVVKDVNDEVNVVEEVVEVINTAKLIGDATTVNTATTTNATITTVHDITLGQALMEIKSTKPKEKGVVIQELGESTTTISSQQSQNKDADHQLAERLQAQEQEELSVEEKATLFQQLLEKRRKHFAAKRAEEKRNKPPTKAQQRKIMLEDLDLLLCGDLKTMFEPHVEDNVWRNQQDYKVLDWKLYDSFSTASKYCNTPKSGLQRNIEYPRALLHRSIAQDMRTTTK